MALRDTAQKLWRGMQRADMGPSNRVAYQTAPSVAQGHYVPSITIFHDKFTDPTQLEFESVRPVLTGDKSAVRKVRCLDNMIGRLLKPFNKKSAPVPDSVVEEIQSHGRDLAKAFRRVSAHPVGRPEARVPALNYTAVRSVNGAAVPQVIATFTLG